MTEFDSDEPDYAERIAGHSDVHQDAWIRTLEDMAAMAEELEAEGWDVITIASGDTATENPDVGQTDRFGLVYVIPGNKAAEFEPAFEAGTWPQYKVFRQEVSNRVFIVTQFLDPETETAILLAGTFEMRHAPGLIVTALEEDEMYTYVQKLDGTVVGTFRHEDYELFFPNAEKYRGYFDDEDGDADEPAAE